MYPPQKPTKKDDSKKDIKKKSLHQKHHSHRDIAERRIDAEVHGFAADNVPGTAYERQPVPYGSNGNLNMYPPQKPTKKDDSKKDNKKKSSLNQHKKHQKWVAERQMDPYVYDFVAPEVDSLTHNLTYGKDFSVYEYDGPFEYNGQQNLYPAGDMKAMM
jgi:hypothetical protein